MDRQAWLDGLTAGDEVRIGDRIARVTRRTPSGRIYVGDMAFNPDGSYRGHHDKWSVSPSLYPVTSDFRDRLQRTALWLSLRSLFEQGQVTLTLDQLQRINTIVGEGKE